MNGLVIEKVTVSELIRKKRDGEALSKEEIAELVRNIVNEQMEACQLGKSLIIL